MLSAMTSSSEECSLTLNPIALWNARLVLRVARRQVHQKHCHRELISVKVSATQSAMKVLT